MEVSPHATAAANQWTEQFTATLHNQRQRVREFLCAQQERLRRAEAGLTAQLQAISRELAEDQHKTRQAREELAQRSEELQRQYSALEQVKAELATRQAEWEKLSHRTLDQEQAFAAQFKQQQEELAQRRQEILEQQSAALAAENKLQNERKAAAAERAELDNQRTQLQASQNSLDMRRRELETNQQELTTQKQSLEKQQQDLKTHKDNLEKLQQEFKIQQQNLEKQQQEREIYQRELENQRQELALQNTETESRRRRIARELKAQHAYQLKELERQRSELELAAAAKNRELQEELESLREQVRFLSSNPPPTAAVEPCQLNEEYRENYHLLYERASQELEELKIRYNELQQEMARLSQNGRGTAAQVSTGMLDWEAEKKRILAALEADHNEGNEEAQDEKLKIESVVQKTEQILADKNREIAELRELLDSQTKQIGSVAVGATAVGEMLDKDLIVQEERQNLKKLQDEWRNKLRQAEVEISLERAKVARERSQLEEKIRILEHQGVALKGELESKEPSKPSRGRWLSRLGLTDSENEEKK
jgi:chromosome segregation ATPase